MTIEEVRGYMNGILETLDGDIPRKLFKKIAKMMNDVETTKIVTGGTTIIERYPYPRHYWCTNTNTVAYSPHKIEIPKYVNTTYANSVSAWKALGASDANSYTA